MHHYFYHRPGVTLEGQLLSNCRMFTHRGKARQILDEENIGAVALLNFMVYTRSCYTNNILVLMARVKPF